MHYLNKYKASGISEKDFKILLRVIKKPSSSFYIANETHIPRPTVLFRLNKLRERGLVDKHGSRPSITWSPTQACLDILIDEPGGETKIISGVKNIEANLMKFLGTSEGKRMYFMENARHLRNIKKKMSSAYYDYPKQDLFSENFIQEGISTESSIKYLKKVREIIPDKDRMISWTIIPDKYLDMDDSFFILDDKVLIVDLERETLIEVENASLAKVLVSYMRSLSRLGKKRGFSRFIEEEM